MIAFRRRFLLGLLTLSIGVFGASMGISTGARAADAPAGDYSKAAGQFVKTLSDKGIQVVMDRNQPDSQRVQRFHDLFVTGFDVPAIGRFVLGRYWRTATDDQKNEFLRLFEDMIVLTYAARFTEYSGEQFQVVATRMDQGGASALVATDVVRPNGGDPIRVDWRVVNSGDSLKVVDVIVEGVSMSVTQQQDFGSLIQRSGNGVDGLIVEMRQRNQANSKG